MSKLFQAPSVIEKVQTLVDGGVKLSVTTQELAESEMTQLFKLKGKAGWFLFKDQAIKEQETKDLPEIEPEFKGEKSPSQRLRNIIYVYWKQQGAKGDKDAFYKRQMNRQIEKVRELLN